MAEKPQTPEDVFPLEQVRTDEIIPEDLAILNILAELGQTGSDAMVSVYRAEALKGFKGGAFLFSCLPDEFTLEKLRDEYGGGAYRIHVRANGGIVANRLVSVEEPKRPKTEIPTSPPADVTTPITAMTQAMIAGFENLGKLIVAAQPQQQSRADMLKEMLMYKELFAAPQSSQGNPLDLVRQGMELAKEFGAGGGKETGTADIVMGLLETFGKPIAEAVSAAQAQQKINQPPLAVPQGPHIAPALSGPAIIAPIPTHPAIMSDTPTVDGDTMQAMKGYINFLIAQAQAGNDVFTYAGMILDQAPPEQVDQFIDRPDWLDFLAQFEPNVKAHELWFSQLRAAIKELLTEESGDGTSIGNLLNGNSDNALGNSHDGGT